MAGQLEDKPERADALQTHVLNVLLFDDDKYMVVLI